MEAWRKNLYVVWFTQIISLMGFGFGLPFLPYYLQELGMTDPDKLKIWTGMLSSAPALTMGIMGPIWGYLADRIGKKIMLLRALLFGSFIIFCMSRVQTPEQLLFFRVIQGMFSGSIGASATLIASGTPGHKLSSSLGFLSSSTFIGMSIGPLIGGFVAETYGYRFSFVVGSLILATGFFLVLFGVTDVRAAKPAAGEKAIKIPMKEVYRSILTPTILISFLIMFILRLTRSIVAPFLPLIVQEFTGQLQGAVSTTGIISAINSVVAAVASLTLTRLGDRTSKPRLLVMFLLCAGVIGLPLYFTGSLFWFVLIYAIMLFPLGGVDPVLQSHVSSMVPPENRGVLFGLQTTVGSIGWFVAPLIGSWVSITWNTQAIFMLFPVLLLSSALIIRLLMKDTPVGSETAGVKV